MSPHFHSPSTAPASRVVTFALGVVMTVVACVTSDVIAALSIAYDILVGALLVPVMGAILWPRGTSLAALVSIAAGSVAVIVLLIVKGVDSDAPIYGGLASSLVSFVALSLGSTRTGIGSGAVASDHT